MEVFSKCLDLKEITLLPCASPDASGSKLKLCRHHQEKRRGQIGKSLYQFLTGDDKQCIHKTVFCMLLSITPEAMA
jgi:hypothetical protein